MYPRITIVTVSYNQASYLESTIKSVLNQNYPNLEYIIMDGGSTDGSLEIIKKYAHTLAYYESAKDNGMYDALNKGFKKSTGEIMAWINSDDIYIPNSFFIVAEIFSKFQNINWLLGCSSLLDEKNRIVKISPVSKWAKYNYYLGEWRWIQQESVFWRKSLWEKTGSRINTSLKVAGDFELWLRFFRYDNLYSLNAPLGCFRLRSKNQKTIDLMDEYTKEAEELLTTEEISDEDRKTLSKIQKYRKLLKLPVSRFYYPLKKKHDALFNYPKELIFDRYKQEYILK